MDLDREAFRAHLEWAEGRRSKPYKDSVGKLTAGVGRNLDDKGLSEEEIDFLLDNDLDNAVLDASTLPYWDLLDPVRRLCVADLVFNLGLTKWRKFVRANAALAAHDYETAAAELEDSKWFTQTGRRARKVVKAMRSGLWTP